MPHPLMRHNPAFLPPDQLNDSFVVRLRDLETVLEVVRENADRPINQHVLVIAARGMGKTTLVLRAANAVRDDPALSATWSPIVWGEEAYQVGTAGEFWLESLLHLGDQTGDPRWSRAHDELLDEPDEDRLAARALGRLLEFADESGRRLLIVVENLQMILGEQMDRAAAWALRHTLMNEPRIMLLATSTVRFRQITSRQEALYELFFEHRLDPLTRDECRVLWERVSGEPLSVGRSRPIEILTGGNTRLLAILASFAVGRSFAALMEELVQLVDEHTDIFKSNFEALGGSERRVFSALADLWRPAKASEVARQARVKVSEASRDLGRLELRGPVTVVGTRGRAKLYQLTERLYNLYHLMRRRGSPAQRVKAAVEFIIHLYPEDDVKPVLRSIADEALRMADCERGDHVWALAGILGRLRPSLRREASRELPAELWQLGDRPSPLWEAMKHDTEFLRERFPLVFAAVEVDEERDEEGTAILRVEGSQWPELHEQIQSFQAAIPEHPLPGTALVLAHLEREDGAAAVEAARGLVSRRPRAPHAWRLLGVALTGASERVDERTDVLRKVVALSPESAEDWDALAHHLFAVVGDGEAAETAIREAVKLVPDSFPYLINLAYVLISRGKSSEALEVIERACLQVRAGERADLEFVGLAFGEAGAFERVVEIADRLIALEPDRVVHRVVRSRALAALGRMDDAERELRELVERHRGVAQPHWHLGQLLEQVRGDLPGAEAAYRAAISLSEDAINPAVLSLHALLNRTDRAVEAVALVDGLAEEGVDAVLWNHLAWTTVTHTADPAALAAAVGWARRAAALDPEILHIRHTLSALLAATDAWDDALAAAGDLVADAAWARDHLDDVIELFVEAAASGQAAAALAVLEPSPAAALAEPLVVALQRAAGQDPLAPQEIAMVADDVLERVAARRAARDAGERWPRAVTPPPVAPRFALQEA